MICYLVEIFYLVGDMLLGGEIWLRDIYFLHTEQLEILEMGEMLLGGDIWLWDIYFPHTEQLKILEMGDMLLGGDIFHTQNN